jgi:uncharacterized protein
MIVISKNITLCSSYFKKSTGLMFTKDKKDFAYIFSFHKERPIIITMWWVFYSIDILFLDRDNTIVELKSNLKPFTLYKAGKQAKTFIELPRHTIKNYSLTKGEKLSWDNKTLCIVR